MAAGVVAVADAAGVGSGRAGGASVATAEADPAIPGVWMFHFFIVCIHEVGRDQEMVGCGRQSTGEWRCRSVGMNMRKHFTLSESSTCASAYRRFGRMRTGCVLVSEIKNVKSLAEQTENVQNA